jgi:glutamine synthetase
MAKYLGDKYQDLFSATKAQEQAEFRKRVTDVEYDAYLSSV